MKIQITFKTPDAVFFALEDLSEEEQEYAKQLLEKWVKYEEVVTVELDTDAKTLNVVPLN
jgi:hypothetical protein